MFETPKQLPTDDLKRQLVHRLHRPTQDRRPVAVVCYAHTAECNALRQLVLREPFTDSCAEPFLEPRFARRPEQFRERQW